MRFSTPLWLLNMLLDVLAKSACCYFLLPSYLIALCLGVIWSSLHLLCLLLTSGLMAALGWPRFLLFGLTLAIANASFLGILYWSVEADTTMTLKDASQFAAILVPINLLPVLMSSAIDFLAKRMWRSWRTGRVGMIAGDPVEEGRFAPFSHRISTNLLWRHWIRRRKRLCAKTVFVALVVVPISLAVASAVGYIARDVYRTNYVCAPGSHVLRSESDAIEAAKKGIVSGRGFKADTFGSIPEFVEALGRNKNCCSAIVTRDKFFVIVWEVSLKTLPETKHHPDATVMLSNCGVVFHDGTYLDAD